MSSNWAKFTLLMWKNLTLVTRNVMKMLAEFLIPTMLCVLLIMGRKKLIPENKGSTSFHPFDPGSLNGTVPGLVPMKVLWAPNCSLLQPVMDEVAEKLNMPQTQGMETSELKRVTEDPSTNMNDILAAVHFEDSLKNLNQLPNKLTITLRFPAESRAGATGLDASWKTNLLFPVSQAQGPRDPQDEGGNEPGYYPEGFLALQNAISVSVIKHMTNTTTIPEVKLQRFPYPPYLHDPLVLVLQDFMHLLLMFLFCYTNSNLVTAVTNEKELQIKETMKIMGLPSWLNWAAWYSYSVLYVSIIVIVVIVSLKVTWLAETGSAVLTQCATSVIIVLMIVYAVTVISFSFMVSAFFSKAIIANIASQLIWFITFFPFILLKPRFADLSLVTKLITCLLSNSAMCFGFQFIIMHEATGEGAQWSNLFTPVTPDDNLVLGHVMVMMILDSILYFLITLYVEAVLPGTYGVPKPWYFPVTSSFWFGEPANHSDDNDAAGSNADNCEKDPKDLPAGIVVKHLRKEYGKKIAVKDLSFNMYEGQITVLLGHNGAGKTTTMSMLTGLITPSGGTAIVGNYDIRTEIEKVRGSLGVCPQHNVLFTQLTVRDHLYFYGKLKGLDGDELEDDIKRYIEILELTSKEDEQAENLSGGMQRKLMTGIALCGGSKVVLLDEPTSGMDPAARRALWDILQAEKPGRTVLLSTHYMDEADYLGDRIAIMAGGELQCCGSSFFLKKKFGAGYHLTVVKGPSCNVTTVTTLLRRHIPSVELSQNTESELQYLLDESKSSSFEAMLQELEKNKDQLHIDSFGVSPSTLEEVFMKVGKDEDTSSKPYTNFFKHTIDSTYKLSGCSLLFAQFYAMFAKRALYTWRTLILLLMQILIPVAFLILSMLMATGLQSPDELPSLPLSLSPYSESYTPVQCLTNDTNVVHLYEEYKHQITTGLEEIDREKYPDMNAYMLQKAKEDIYHFGQNYIAGATFDMVNSSTATVIGWFSNQPYHGIPVALNLVHNSILKSYDQSNSLEYINSPLPFNLTNKMELERSSNILKGAAIIFQTVYGISLVSAFCLWFYIKERANKAKHLQFVSGANVFIFWTAAFLWDFVQLLAPIFAIIVTLAAFQTENLQTAEELGRIFAVLVAFGFAALPLMYVTSLLFDDQSTGYSAVIMLGLLIGVVGAFVIFYFKWLSGDNPTWSSIVDWILSIVPHYLLANSCAIILFNRGIQKSCEPILPFCNITSHGCCRDNCLNDCFTYTDNYFGWEEPGVGRHFTFFFIDGIIFLLILLLIEYRTCDILKYCCQRSKNTDSSSDDNNDAVDSDVQSEKTKIESAEIPVLVRNHALVLRNVTKRFGRFVAVNNLCVGVRKGECFGLLGHNGAGKTTTFRMMTGDETISSGDAYVNGFSLKKDMKKVHQTIGYCPQFDALIDELTGRETIWMFCILRGAPPSFCCDAALKIGSQFSLKKDIDKKVKLYSGGNKRKLNTALALLGDPAVIYLDEPTCGLDPAARRKIWNIIASVRDSGKCVILTSHSMEECEALCTRVAVMVNGKFECLGSVQHLKSKFAKGYTVSIKVKKSKSAKADLFDTDPVKKFIVTSFPGAVLRQEFQGLLTYDIPSAKLTWSQIFGMMEKAKKQLNIEDYSLGQTSLEQVFLNIVATQEESQT